MDAHRAAEEDGVTALLLAALLSARILARAHRAAGDLLVATALALDAQLVGAARLPALAAVERVRVHVDAAAAARLAGGVARLDAAARLAQAVARAVASAAVGTIGARVDARAAAAGQPVSADAHPGRARLRVLVTPRFARAGVRGHACVPALHLARRTFGAPFAGARSHARARAQLLPVRALVARPGGHAPVRARDMSHGTASVVRGGADRVLGQAPGSEREQPADEQTAGAACARIPGRHGASPTAAVACSRCVPSGWWVRYARQHAVRSSPVARLHRPPRASSANRPRGNRSRYSRHTLV